MAVEASQVIVADGRMPRRESNNINLPAINDASGIMNVIANAARDPNVDVEKMLKLYDIRDRELARQAKQAFADAMSRFKENPPKIIKDKHVKIPHKQGPGFTEYDHTSLGHLCEKIIEGLAAVGISHSWQLEQIEGGQIRVTCILTHRDGHETRTPLHSSRDDSGSKNNLQAMSSAISYLERYTLFAATGLASGMPDDDGRGAEPEVERITDSQVADLNALITEVGANKDSLLNYLKLDSLADIPAERYVSVVRAVEAKRKASAGKPSQVRR